jgi:anti-sigma regulatory factor (Ser/Thr protein kinase)
MADRFAASITVPGRIESVRPAAAFLVNTAKTLNIAAATHHLFEVAIVEALTNALEHNDRGGDEAIHCEIELDEGRLTIRVLDEAARAPLSLRIPTGGVPWNEVPPESIQNVPESGYGLYLMRAIFSEVRPITRNGQHGVELQLMTDAPLTNL